MVQGEIVLSMLTTTGCPLSPNWMARYYVGCLAACAEWQKQLSHLLHSIFICQPASGEAWGDLGPPRRSIFVQQVKLCSKEPRKRTSFTPRWGRSPIHHRAESKILIQESNQVPRRIAGDYCCHLFFKWPSLRVTSKASKAKFRGSSWKLSSACETCYQGWEKRNLGFPGGYETQADRIHFRLLGANMV